MESDVLDAKHQAQEHRYLAVHDDLKRTKTDLNRKIQQNTVSIENKEQSRLKSKLRKQRRREEQAVPHIAGNEGYPRIPEMSIQERRELRSLETNYIASELKKQIAEKGKREKSLKARDLEQDEEYLAGWAERKDLRDVHYATSGNLG